MQGLFITFEGIEGCGKTSQAKLLNDYLTALGHDVMMTREPGGTPISEAVREILLSNDSVNMHPHTEVLLYLASRAQHVSEIMKPALGKGRIVICDRFADSTFVYQCFVRGINKEIVETMNNFAVGHLQPDITFVLDVEPAEGLHRAMLRNQKHSRGQDRIENESLDFHNKVREGYLKLAQEYPDRVHLIKTDKDKSEVHEEIKKVVDTLLRLFPLP
ncbi:MAG: dTMP kinase [Nitrospirae bacterium]|nr:dTMP kinase [Nitrospirota bacterium]